MKTEWPAMEHPAPPAASLRIASVLVEYEGPQVALFVNGNGERFIGCASDSDSGATRWVVAPLSDATLASLQAEGIAFRDVLTAGDVLICDVEWSEKMAISSAWSMRGADVPDFALPESGAVMPAEWFDEDDARQVLP